MKYLINDWDEIFEEYSNDQFPPFGGPFNDALPFQDWLKQNYSVPERKITLSEKDAEIFYKEFRDPSEPNENLVSAALEYQEYEERIRLKAREEAYNLVDMFLKLDFGVIEEYVPVPKAIAKACALAAVNKIIEANPFKFDEDDDPLMAHFYEIVKQEIEKL